MRQPSVTFGAGTAANNQLCCTGLPDTSVSFEYAVLRANVPTCGNSTASAWPKIHLSSVAIVLLPFHSCVETCSLESSQDSPQKRE
jgi:hypothetical protein